KLEDRAARLNYLIHTSKAPASRLKKWKNRIVAMLDRPRPIFSYSELAERLGTSKTTISRRIDQARTGVRVIQEAL
ncbi:MAG TPA: HTH domain-containing protein, partial [Leptospiraceae bacterium]|nr:HTH domain-containing protein [Leptospiraceae bacterium]